MSKKTIGFFANELCFRGTGVALYTYADYNEKILGNKSIIFSISDRDMSAYPKFIKRFPTYFIGSCGFGSISGMDQWAYDTGVDYMYWIKAGNNDGGQCGLVPTLIHAVFQINDPHGYRYAYVSDWLARSMGYDAETHSVPHIVEPMPTVDRDLRSDLGIPRSATVFGCYGGGTEFNINWVHEAMDRIVSERNDIYFIFMNIPYAFRSIVHDHSQLKFLPGSWDLYYKSRFIQTCDAMIHARTGGETFGLAVAEFSISNKPVITYRESGERNHIEMLGERGIYYSDYDEVYEILTNFKNYIKYDDYNCYRSCSPEIIMDKFNRVFLS